MFIVSLKLFLFRYINMDVISVAEKGAIMGAAVLQIFTLCGVYFVLLLMLFYMCGLFNERSVSRGAAFTAFATGMFFMINVGSMCLEDEEGLGWMIYKVILLIGFFFTGKTSIYNFWGRNLWMWVYLIHVYCRKYKLTVNINIKTI